MPSAPHFLGLSSISSTPVRPPAGGRDACAPSSGGAVSLPALQQRVATLEATVAHLEATVAALQMGVPSTRVPVGGPALVRLPGAAETVYPAAAPLEASVPPLSSDFPSSSGIRGMLLRGSPTSPAALERVTTAALASITFKAVGSFENLLLLGRGCMPGFIGVDFSSAWVNDSTKSKLLQVYQHLVSLTEVERSAFCAQHSGLGGAVQLTKVYKLIKSNR